MGGCINGAGCLTHGDEKNKSLVEKYGKAAGYKTINDVVSKLKLNNFNFNLRFFSEVIFCKNITPYLLALSLVLVRGCVVYVIFMKASFGHLQIRRYLPLQTNREGLEP